MSLTGWRSAVATALSLWLGVLACFFGCAKPSGVIHPVSGKQAAGLIAAPCPDRGSDTEDACCGHGHNTSNRPEKNERHSNSCCPADTALAPKQTAVHIASANLYVAALLLGSLHPLNLNALKVVASPSTVWHSGRDILLQVRILRI